MISIVFCMFARSGTTQKKGDDLLPLATISPILGGPGINLEYSP